MSKSIISRFSVTLAAVLCCGCSAPAQPTAADERPSLSPGQETSVAAAVNEPAENLWTRRTGEDWPAFLGPRGDGTSTETGVDPQLWKPHPPLLWSMPLGISYGGPTLVAGRLLQFDRFGQAERLTCCNAETGQELWRRESQVDYEDMYGYNNGPRCSPVVSDDLVYTYGVAGQLTCCRLSDGKTVWQKDTLADYGVVQNFFGIASTPYAFDNLLLVMIGGSPEASRRLPAGQLGGVKPNGTAIVAFDKATGREAYRLGDELASYSSLAVRDIAGKPTALAFLRGGLLAWDPATGQELFNFPWRASSLESVNAASPITLGDKILLSEAYEIGSALLEVKDQQPTVVWRDSGPLRQHAFRAHWSTPVLAGDFLFGSSGRNQPDSDFRCIRISDGELRWSDRRHERSSVLLVDGCLVVLGEYGRLELMRANETKLDVVARVELNEMKDAKDNQPLIDYPCWAAPVLSHGLLYVRGNRRLLCFELIPESPVRAPN